MVEHDIRSRFIEDLEKVPDINGVEKISYTLYQPEYGSEEETRRVMPVKASGMELLVQAPREQVGAGDLDDYDPDVDFFNEGRRELAGTIEDGETLITVAGDEEELDHVRDSGNLDPETLEFLRTEDLDKIPLKVGSFDPVFIDIVRENALGNSSIGNTVGMHYYSQEEDSSVVVEIASRIPETGEKEEYAGREFRTGEATGGDIYAAYNGSRKIVFKFPGEINEGFLEDFFRVYEG